MLGVGRIMQSQALAVIIGVLGLCAFLPQGYACDTVGCQPPLPPECGVSENPERCAWEYCQIPEHFYHPYCVWLRDPKRDGPKVGLAPKSKKKSKVNAGSEDTDSSLKETIKKQVDRVFPSNATQLNPSDERARRYPEHPYVEDGTSHYVPEPLAPTPYSVPAGASSAPGTRPGGIQPIDQ